ncbi:S8 family peptidase [Lonepinella koalarum]|uniref:S8 family peptidase n=1 Tax=Lonepinella koalarum TaxID=53417 RepID=UPI003F6DCDA2
MSNYPWKRTLLAIVIGIVMTSKGYAEDIDENDEQQQAPQSGQMVNPHDGIGLTEQISAQYSGDGVKVGVIDSGFMNEHPLFNQQKLHSLTFEITDNDGNKKIFDANHYELETEDENGEQKTVYSMHGGQVAGIIGANSFLQYRGGVAKNADVYLTTTEATETPQDDDTDDSDNSKDNDKSLELLLGNEAEIKDHRNTIATAFAQHTANKVFVINNSWNEDPVDGTARVMDDKYKSGIEKATDNVLINAIKDAVKKDTLIVFAAGNESKQQPGIMAALPRYLPELEKHYLSVIAVDDGENIADYSNRCGVSQNWCVAAPGTLSVLVTEGAEQNIKLPGLQVQQGTSFAAPVVTGSLAVLKQRFQYFTATQVRDTLLTTATDLGAKGVDDVFGWGLINLSKAINGPSQLLNNETYTLSSNDRWNNPLTGEYRLTKQGQATLTLAGENNRLKEISVGEGKLALTNTTSVDQIRNESKLALTALTVNQAFYAKAGSQLELLAQQAFTAQGKGTVVNLNGVLSVAESLKQNTQAGQTIADVLVVKNGATYTGGFEQLISSDTLTAKGLRQDLYFKNDRIELKANPNQPFTDPQANSNGQNGLQALNALRDSSTAWKKGLYNDWLQHAIEHNDLQNFHYAIGNTIYADSLDLLRNNAAIGLTETDNHLYRYHDSKTDSVRVWVESDGQKYKSDHHQFDQKTEVKTRHTGMGFASKANEKSILTGNLTRTKSDVTKNQASATIKQIEANAALRYMPLANGWFVDVTGKIARLDYKQNRQFNSASLASGANKGWLFGSELRTGYNLAINDWYLEPSAGLQAIRLNMQQFTENGELATSTSSFHKTDVNLSSGLHLKKSFDLSDWKITPNFDLSYIRHLNGKPSYLESRLNGIAIHSESTTFSKNIAVFGLGMMLEKGNWLLSTDIHRRVFKNGKTTDWQVKVGLSF